MMPPAYPASSTGLARIIFTGWALRSTLTCGFEAAGMGAFAGPLFIVGSARSGTKLLRDLLNRSGQINLCNPETHFIPFLYRRFGGNPTSFDAPLDQLYREFNRTPFQLFSCRMGKRIMTRSDFDALGGAETWAEAFEIILRFYGDPDAGATAVWGDKTPSYVLEMRLLAEIFPQVKFIHIIRDPRDVALSARRVWDHNIYRVAGKWYGAITTARRDAANLGSNYLEIFYERLLADPEQELRRACFFVERAFDPAMTTLLLPSENIGDAKGKRFIDARNLGKYKKMLLPREQKRIEEIVFPTLADTPYDAAYATGHRPLSTIERAALTAIDGSKSALRYVRKKGLSDGIRISVGNRLQKRRRFHSG
jgi:hypothetical protein